MNIYLSSGKFKMDIEFQSGDTKGIKYYYN